mmetsp:Transcript_47620/g.128455  ORF Transcript_47620/g.128455 Transcript_47620/m.128455 type:complete len:466 (-) Transcript_47620:116-1513(-)
MNSTRTSTMLALQCLVMLASWTASRAVAPPKTGATDSVTNGSSELLTVPLRKQYVPIEKNGAVIAYKTSYFGNILVGMPEPQEFTVVFDTGSAHLVLPCTGCESETCAKHRLYNRSLSGTSVDIEHDGKLVPAGVDKSQREQLSITFGTGKVVGEFAEDRVCLGPRAEDCSTMRVVLANDMSAEPFGLFAFDGVLGLGLDALALNPEFSFFGRMTGQQPAMLPQFSVFLARNDESLSTISFGGHQPERAASELRWAPVAMPELGYWQVEIKSVRIGGEVIEDCEGGRCRAILDTGTSLLGVPRQVSRPMQRLLARTPPQDANVEDMDCRDVQGNDIEFDLGDQVVRVGAEDYSRPRPFNITADTPEGWQLSCRSLLLPLDIEAPLGPLVFIWGEPVLRKYLTIYDWSAKQIGFADAGAPAGPAELDAVGRPPAGSLAAGAPLLSRPLARTAAAEEAERAGSTLVV